MVTGNRERRPPMISKKLKTPSNLEELKEEFFEVFRAYQKACDQVEVDIAKISGRARIKEIQKHKRFGSLTYQREVKAYEDFLEKINSLPKKTQEEFWSLIGI
jgi:hypothetical protein